MPTDGTRLLNHFRTRSKDLTGREPILSRAKSSSQAAFILKHMDFDDAVSIIDWVFDNWDRVQEYLKLRNSTPRFSLFASTFMDDFRDLREKGFGVNPKNRFVEDSSPATGWE